MIWYLVVGEEAVVLREVTTLIIRLMELVT